MKSRDCLKLLNTLKDNGYAIVLIAHKLREVLECADRITVLRAGVWQEALLRAEATKKALIQLMFDKQLTTRIVREEERVPPQNRFWNWFHSITHAEGSAVSLKDIESQGFSR